MGKQKPMWVPKNGPSTALRFAYCISAQKHSSSTLKNILTME
jgi:hypothetical protein